MSKSFKVNKTSQTVSKKALIKQALIVSATRKLKRAEWS
jgi:hypothetical protein